MLKRICAILLFVCMLALTSCGGGSTTTTDNNTTTETKTETTAEDTTTADDTTSTEEKTEDTKETEEATPEADTTAEVTAGESLIISVGSTGAIFDPQYNSGADSSIYMTQMFEGLFYYDAGGILKNGMCKDYTVSEDGMVYTFTIRDDAKWSDGKAVTAEDFVFAFTRLVDPELAANNGPDLGGFIKNGRACWAGEVPLSEFGCKLVDEMTFEVTLEDPVPYFEDIISGSTFFPLRSDVAKQGDEGNEGKWSQNLEANIGNGPYKMVEYDPDLGFKLERNEYYYDKTRQVPDSIEFMFLQDENAALGAFTAGEINFTSTMPSEEIPRLINEGVYHKEPRLGTFFLMINQTKEPYNDARVRKALALCVDPNYIVSNVLNGRNIPAKAWVGPGFGGSEAGKDFREEGGDLLNYDDMDANIQKARDLLAEAGYPNGEGFPVMEFLYNVTVDNKAIAESLQSTWETELGIKVNLSAVEGAAMAEIRKSGGFDVTRQGWLADYNDPIGMMNVFTKDSGINEGHYFNEKYDELFVQGTKTADTKARMDIVHEMEQILIDDMGCIPVFHYTYSFLYDPAKITGIYMSPSGALYFMKTLVK